jgi:hypothetical protein
VEFSVTVGTRFSESKVRAWEREVEEVREVREVREVEEVRR